MEDPIIKTIEDWSGHTESRTERRQALCWLVAALALVLTFCLTSCMTASGNRTTGEWKTSAVGTDASKYKVGPEGMEIEGLNQSAGLGKIADTIKGMWSNTLTGMAFKYAAGKYYDNKGAELSAAKTVDLEKLRNAKSVADAQAAQKMLDSKLAAEAAAAAAAVPVP